MFRKCFLTHTEVNIQVEDRKDIGMHNLQKQKPNGLWIFFLIHPLLNKQINQTKSNKKKKNLRKVLVSV